jgi:glycosyltransferase involved in cell wall biosynthesis
MSETHTRDGVRPWRVLMIGDGRALEALESSAPRFRLLLDELPEIHGVVVGGNSDADEPRVRVVAAPDWRRPLRLVAFLRAIHAEARHVAIIDVHSPHDAFVPLLLGVFRDRPIVVHVDAMRRASDRRRSFTQAARAHLRCAIAEYVYGQATIAITPTGSSKRVLVEEYAFSPWRARVLAPAVGAAYLADGDRTGARAELDFPDGAFVACCVRPLVSRVGIRILLDAWSLLLSSGAPGARPARLLIAGTDELHERLQEEVAASGAANSVSVLRPESAEAIASLYRAADVQIVPSRPVEGRGRVVLEAASCGTPSIVALPGRLPDGLGELDETLVVAPNDPLALARRLERATRGQLPAPAATRAWAQRNGMDLAAQHRAVYDQLLVGSPTPQKLRVVYVGHVAQPSGGEIAMARLIAALPDVEAHVILAEDGPLVARLLAAGVSVEVLPLRERTRELRKGSVTPRGLPLAALLDTAVYTLRLARRLRAIKPDVVHTNTLKAGVYGSAAARMAGVPSVWHVRDRISADYLPRVTAFVLRRLISSMPDGVIANSNATRSTLRYRDDTLVVPSIVHDPVTAPRQTPTRAARESLVVGIIGRLAPWKGQHVFLEAFARAFADGQTRALIVGSAMFGDAETRYAEDLHTLARSLGVADRVEFRGFRPDVWAELADMDVFVHASITAEPFGQVIVEAMLADVPVVAAAGGGPSEIISDGIDGLLYPPGDVERLSAALQRLAGDPSLRARLSASARSRAATFSQEAAARETMSMYRLLIAAGRDNA